MEFGSSLGLSVSVSASGLSCSVTKRSVTFSDALDGGVPISLDVEVRELMLICSTFVSRLGEVTGVGHEFWFSIVVHAAEASVK